MSIDRQRISAVKKLEQLGYSFDGSNWQQPTSGATAPNPAGDELYAILVRRAEELWVVPTARKRRELSAVSAATVLAPGTRESRTPGYRHLASLASPKM